MTWTPFVELSKLPPGKMKAHAGILVVHLADGGLYAVDNACPHQGYPLVQGTVSGCALTCTWHNFKFDVRNGECLMGEEALRTHAVRVVEGMIEVSANTAVDLTPRWNSLSEAVSKHQSSRIAREVARLLSAETPALWLLLYAAVRDADFGEFGPGHTGALAADLADLLDAPAPDRLEHQVRIVVDALDIAAESTRGMPKRTIPDAEVPNESASQNELIAELRRRVETENAPGAEALLRGMVLAGWQRPALEQALYPLVADHFLDFGHPLIYVGKHLDLLRNAPVEHTASVLGALVFGIVNGTREDLLPPWTGFRNRWKTFVESDGPARAQRARHSATKAEGVQNLREAIAEGTPAACFAAVAEALCAGAWEPVLDALNLAGADRVLRFDTAFDADPTVSEAWLDITHRLTVPHAVRRAVAEWDHPDCARIVLMVAHFVNAGKALDLPPERRESPNQHPDPKALVALALSPRAIRPIFYAHDIKTTMAAIAESARLDSRTHLQAAHRFLTSPLCERIVPRFAHEAVRLVREGKPPHTLTG